MGSCRNDITAPSAADPDVSTSTPVRTADVAAGVARSDEHLDDVDGAGNDGARHPQQRGEGATTSRPGRAEPAVDPAHNIPIEHDARPARTRQPTPKQANQ
jgi:hypothetical protein